MRAPPARRRGGSSLAPLSRANRRPRKLPIPEAGVASGHGAAQRPRELPPLWRPPGAPDRRSGFARRPVPVISVLDASRTAAAVDAAWQLSYGHDIALAQKRRRSEESPVERGASLSPMLFDAPECRGRGAAALRRHVEVELQQRRAVGRSASAAMGKRATSMQRVPWPSHVVPHIPNSKSQPLLPRMIDSRTE